MDRGMIVATESPRSDAEVAVSGVAAGDLERKNRRTAAWLLGWIVFLMLVALVVIWVRN
jgi:hypothetical protein